jgi:hypothetical protein
MTIVKSWGKALGANPTKVIHNSNSDITDVHNTAAGVTSGSFLGEGWSIPPPRTNAELRPFYPAQDPYFIDYRTDIKPTNDAFSIRCFNPVGYPIGTTIRNEVYTNKMTYARQAIGFSFYIPDTVGYEPTIRKIIFQTHTLNSPGFSLEEDRNGYLSFRMTRNGDATGVPFRFRTDLITRNTWHHVTIFITYSPTLNGRVTVWLDRKLARARDIDGNIQVIPVSTGLYNIDATRGTLPLEGNDEGTPVTLFDYNGYTMPTDTSGGGDVGNISQKAGYYQSSLSTFIHPVSTLISRWESGDFDIYSGLEKAERVSLINYDDSLGAKYIPTNVRQPTIYFTARFAIWGAGQTDEEVFREVHHNGEAPLEAPADFVFDTPTPNYTISTSATTGGSVVQSPIGGIFETGQAITLTATASSGFTFSRFRNTATNQTLSLNSVYSFNLTENISIEAVFVADSVPTTGRKFFGRKKRIL